MHAQGIIVSRHSSQQLIPLHSRLTVYSVRSHSSIATTENKPRRNALFHDTRLNNCNLLTCFVVDKLCCTMRPSLATHLLYMHKSFCTPASSYAVFAYTQASDFTKECVVVYIIEPHQTNGPDYFCTAISPNQGRRIVSRYSSQQLHPPYMFRAWLS